MTDFQPFSRLKDWYVPEHLMVAVAVAFVTGKCPYSVTSNLDLPDDVKVIGIFHDFYRKTFVVRFRHDSFEPVPNGTQIPELKVDVIFRELPRQDADCPAIVGR